MDDATAHASKPLRRAGSARQKVPQFARYVGTSAWRKDRRRVRAYARYRADVAGHRVVDPAR